MADGAVGGYPRKYAHVDVAEAPLKGFDDIDVAFGRLWVDAGRCASVDALGDVQADVADLYITPDPIELPPGLKLVEPQISAETQRIDRLLCHPCQVFNQSQVED